MARAGALSPRREPAATPSNVDNQLTPAQSAVAAVLVVAGPFAAMSWWLRIWEPAVLAAFFAKFVVLLFVAERALRHRRSTSTLVEAGRSLAIASPLMLLSLGLGLAAERWRQVGLLSWLGPIGASTPRLASIGLVLAGLTYGATLALRLRLSRPEEIEVPPEEQEDFVRRSLEKAEAVQRALEELSAEDRRHGSPDAPTLADILTRLRVPDERPSDDAS